MEKQEILNAISVLNSVVANTHIDTDTKSVAILKIEELIGKL